LKGIILGAGEVGGAYHSILSKRYKVWRLDLKPELTDKDIPDSVDILHVCLRYLGKDQFLGAVSSAVFKHSPKIINVMSTVPPGTTEEVQRRTVRIAAHSTTRGLHPRLEEYILATPKHVGGEAAEQVAEYFRAAGVGCVTHAKARTTELAHILSNSFYAASILFAQEMEALCREYGVDYYEAVMRYNETHNQGFEKMGMVSKFRPILHPPGDSIGGHCLVQNANLIPQELRGEIMQMIATYNGAE
jgi:UDP-N-acetyl-D-mannosaminuronate dehydrogenase